MHQTYSITTPISTRSKLETTKYVLSARVVLAGGAQFQGPHSELQNQPGACKTRRTLLRIRAQGEQHTNLLDRARASVSSLNFITATTGPKISSWLMRMSSVQPVSSVGAKKFSPISCLSPPPQTTSAPFSIALFTNSAT